MRCCGEEGWFDVFRKVRSNVREAGGTAGRLSGLGWAGLGWLADWLGILALDAACVLTLQAVTNPNKAKKGGSCAAPAGGIKAACGFQLEIRIEYERERDAHDSSTGWPGVG